MNLSTLRPFPVVITYFFLIDCQQCTKVTKSLFHIFYLESQDRSQDTEKPRLSRSTLLLSLNVTTPLDPFAPGITQS